MANGKGTETPAYKIATAQATLQLALRLHAEAIGGRLTPDLYAREVLVNTGGAGVRIPPFPEGTKENLVDGTFNLVLIALGASALTADETLDEVFGKAAVDAEPTRIGVRAMVNQLRNAFAHNPWRPKWVIHEKYRREYPITLNNGSRFTFDARNLDGDGVKPEQVGGLEFWARVLKHCEQLVEEAS